MPLELSDRSEIAVAINDKLQITSFKIEDENIKPQEPAELVDPSNPSSKGGRCHCRMIHKSYSNI